MSLRLLVPLFALLLYACGGGGNVGGEDRGIVLKLSEVSQGPYSRLTLRISGKDFEPLTYSKEGPLQPGQKVIFNVNVPQGSERLIEAILYDKDGRPVYYAYVVSDLTPDAHVVLELKPTGGSAEVFEGFLDQMVKIGGRVLVLSEDLYSTNWQLDANTRDLLPGAYLAFITPKGVFYASVGERLVVESLYTLYLQDAPADVELFGSVEGPAQGNLTASSLRVASDKRVALVGFGDGLYYAVGSSLEQPISLSGPTCRSGSEPDCGKVRVSVQGFYLDATQMLATYKGITFPVGRPDGFLLSDLLNYSVRLERRIESQGCNVYVSVFADLPKPLPAEHSVSLSPIPLSMDPPFQNLRAYSKGFSATYECRVSRREFLTFPKEGESVRVEALLDDQWVGTTIQNPSSVKEFKMHPFRIKDVSLSLAKDYLLFEFSTNQRPKYCSLELFSANYYAHVSKIPPHRSYLKISKLSDRFFETIPCYKLTCFWEEGYARKEQCPTALY